MSVLRFSVAFLRALRDSARANLMNRLVEESIIAETKSMEKNHPDHAKQLRTHLGLSKLRLELVLNFGLKRMKGKITRIVNGLQEAPSLMEEHE